MPLTGIWNKAARAGRSVFTQGRVVVGAQLQNTSLLPNTVEMTEVVLARSIGVFSLLLVALALPDLLQNTGGPPGLATSPL
ncbi:hypothetical protein [Arthrobacter sp. BF1]|uniref:hypothetical protein n=1 Tax=Arthrobacter sp. BF1 TaxID=2821145 RepID=UPI001C4EAEBD|nr:hypothetical protein [Arthrobacter sp. BF1]